MTTSLPAQLAAWLLQQHHFVVPHINWVPVYMPCILSFPLQVGPKEATFSSFSLSPQEHFSHHYFPVNETYLVSRLLTSLVLTAKSLQSCSTLCGPTDGSPPGSPHHWDSPGKNTGVGCHFLLQCMKVKSESEVAQLCPTLSEPMDCSLPGSSIHGIFQERVLDWGAIAFSTGID